MKSGWRREPARHSLAARGVPSKGIMPAHRKWVGSTNGKVYPVRLELWHKTTRERAVSILKNGFDLGMRGTAGLGGKTDVPGVSFGGKGYSISDEMLAYDMKVDPEEIVRLNVVGDLHIFNSETYQPYQTFRLKSNADVPARLTGLGYDAIRYPSGEVVVLDPSKVRVIGVSEPKLIGDAIGVDWSKVKLHQFEMGLQVEREHGTKLGVKTNVTDDDAMATGRIALAHLKEMPDYYTKLKKMEGGS